MINLDELVSGAYRKRLFWLLQCGGWLVASVLGVVFTSVAYSSWSDAVALTLCRTGFGFVATCLLRLIYRRMRNSRYSVRLLGVSAFFICGLVGAIEVLISFGFGLMLGIDMDGSGRGRFDNLSNFLQASLVMRWVLYWFWTVLYFVIN